MNIKYFSLLFLLLLLLHGCSYNNANKNKNKLIVTTTIFPLFDFTREIGKDKIDTKLILPSGADIHAFEPKPNDIISINKSDIFIYINKELEPWVHDLLKGISNKNLSILKVDQSDDNNKHNNDHKHKPHQQKDDPHIWLDPLIAKEIVNKITDVLIQKDPINKKFYLSNSNNYLNKLDLLHKEITNTLKRCKYQNIVYTDHFAFGYFIKRYNLKHTSLYKSFSSTASPTPGSIIKMINRVNETGINHIFYDALNKSKTVQLISKETNTKPLPLHSIHNISLDNKKNQQTYLTMMRKNLENLKTGLEYK